TSGRVHHVDQPPAVVEELCDLREARLDPPEPVGRLGGESLDLRLEGGDVLIVLLLLPLRDVRGPAHLGGLALLLLAPHALCLRPAHSDPPAECELECVLECVLLWSITRARGLTPLAPSGTRDPLCELRCVYARFPQVRPLLAGRVRMRAGVISIGSFLMRIGLVRTVRTQRPLVPQGGRSADIHGVAELLQALESLLDGAGLEWLALAVVGQVIAHLAHLDRWGEGLEGGQGATDIGRFVREWAVLSVDGWRERPDEGRGGGVDGELGHDLAAGVVAAAVLGAGELRHARPSAPHLPDHLDQVGGAVDGGHLAEAAGGPQWVLLLVAD